MNRTTLKALAASTCALLMGAAIVVPEPEEQGAPAQGVPALGANASLHGKKVFPADNPWNTPVDKLPVDPNSQALIASIGSQKPLHPDFGASWQGVPNGIPYVVVAGSQPRVPIAFDYEDESEKGPYPIPPSAPIEGGANGDGDRHVLVIDRDSWKLYELFASHRVGRGWHAGSGAIFDLKTNALRPAGWTSSDAAGLPIFPGLARYDEVMEQGEIGHALRFTARLTRRAYVSPARHWASSRREPNLPPMGMRVRLKASYNIKSFPRQAQVILRALQKYGMMLADNGSDWFLSGAPDSRWSDDELGTLKRIKGSDLEVVRMDHIVTG